MATKNKLYTPSYFMKRLRENNIPVENLNIKYVEGDERYWSMLLYPNSKNIIIDCIKNDEAVKFRLNPYNIIIETLSMEVLIFQIKLV